MNRSLILAALSLTLALSGCASVSSSTAELTSVPEPRLFAHYSTDQLMVRRDQLLEIVQAIQHEVDLKAGLPMAVGIPDERGKLTDLYAEARQIDRELLRRWNNGDSTARMVTAKAELE